MPQQLPKVPPEELYRQPGAMEHKKNWFALHHILAYLLFGLLALAVVVGIFYFQISNLANDIQPVIHHDTTSTWKTYTNSKYGFEFKYPPVYKLSEPGNVGLLGELTLVDESTNDYYYITIAFGNEFSIKKGELDCADEPACSVSPLVECIKEICIKSGSDQYSAYKKVTLGKNKDGLIFEFMLRIEGSELLDYEKGMQISSKNLERINNFNQILSTFKFTNLLPTDSVETEKETLGGIDSNMDGIRDDLERYLVSTYASEPNILAALKQYVKPAQKFILDYNDSQKVFLDDSLRNRALECLLYLEPVRAFDLRDALRVRLLNTKARQEAYDAGDSLLSGYVFPALDPSITKCDFTPTNQAK